MPHCWSRKRRFDVAEYFGINVFLRDGDAVYRTYFVTGRGAEAIGTPWSFLDLTPLGRQEAWEDSPPGRPQGPPYHWWRRHDEYGELMSGIPATARTPAH